MFVRFQQRQTIKFELLPQPIHFVDDVLEFLRSVKVTQKRFRGCRLSRPVPGKSIPAFHERKVALNRGCHRVMIGFPRHQIVGVQITFMRENNAFCSPRMDRIRKHLTPLLQRLC